MDLNQKLASLICSWLVVHGAYVNVERLAKLAKFYPEKTHLETGAKSPAEIVRRIGCSYEPAHRVFREYQLVQKAA